CDEATSALDPQTTAQILDLLRAINRDLGLTIVLITHEMAVVRDLCERMVVLDGGRVVEAGPVADIFVRPQSPVTGRLLQEVLPTLPGDVAARLLPHAGSGSHPLIRLHLSGAETEAP